MANTAAQYALITGASKGIGKSMALALAKRGFNLYMVSRSEQELKDLAKDVQEKYGVRAETLSADLSKIDGAKQTADWIKQNNWPLSVLINNAGYGIWGEYADLNLEEQLEMCHLNMDTVVYLSHELIPVLKKADQSYIMNVASTAAYQAVPTLAVYSATKAFVLSFTRALRFELKKTSVSVSCLCPGPADTGFAQRAGMDALSKMAAKFNMQPDIVAEAAINGMLKRKSEIIPGFTNRIGAYANRFLPKAFIENMISKIYRV